MRNIFKAAACTVTGLATSAAVWLLSLFLQKEKYVSSVWLCFGVLMVLLVGGGLAVCGSYRQKKRAADRARRHEMEIERVRAERVMQELWGDAAWAKTDTPVAPEPDPALTDGEWMDYIDTFSTDGK